MLKNRQCCIEVYACGLQQVREATKGQHCTPNGTTFLLTMSSLMEAFISALGVKVTKKSTIGCWSDPQAEVPEQDDEGPLALVIAYLDELAVWRPSHKAWDQFIWPELLPTPAKDEELAYIKGHIVEVGPCKGPFSLIYVRSLYICNCSKGPYFFSGCA